MDLKFSAHTYFMMRNSNLNSMKIHEILMKFGKCQLMEYLEVNKFHAVSSYRRMRSTDLAATLFLDNFRKEVDKGNLVGVVFMDLSKVFDTIAHSTLLGKLTTYEINNKELDWFTSYLFNRQI